MSQSWLNGDLGGVEPRAELDLLRAAVVEALHVGDSVQALVQSLAALDPVACAELVAGPRAPAHPDLVRAALGSAHALETVLPPTGLYRRLADLAPSILGEIVRKAGERHPGAAWIWRLSGAESVPGQTALMLASEDEPERAPYIAMEHGYRKAVVHRAALGDAPSLRALYDKAPRESLLSALEMALHGGVTADVVAWVAAWHGPDVEPIFRAVARRLTTPAAREQLLRLSWALPLTAQELT
ncbi:MAG: hypothetical protein AB8H79_11790 [Myxococcota bacterium]